MRWPGSIPLLVGLVPLLYAAAIVLSGLNAGAIEVALPTLAALLGVALLAREGTPAAWVAGAAFFAAGAEVVWVALLPGTVGPLGFGVALGVVSAGPGVVLLSLGAPSEGVGTRLVGVQVALTDGLLLLAARSARPAGAGGAEAALNAYFHAIAFQVSALVALVTQAGTVSPPLAATFDPWYVAFAALPLLAILLTILRPASGRGIPLPTRRERAEGPDGSLLELPGRFRAILAARSAPRPPPFPRLPGAWAVVAGGLSAAVYVLFASVAPAFALPVAGLGAVVGVVGIGALLRRPVRPGGPPGAGDRGASWPRDASEP